MRPAIRFTALICILACAAAPAAPAPTDEQLAKAKLEPLRKKLPEVLAEAVNKSERWSMKFEATVQSLRQIGPAEAKLTIRLEALAGDGNGTLEKVPTSDEVLVIYLTYYDGVWTTRRFDGTWNDLEIGGGAGPGGGGRIMARGARNNRAAKFLLAAIDEATEKKE
jgi:hypothetical protein